MSNFNDNKEYSNKDASYSYRKSTWHGKKLPVEYYDIENFVLRTKINIKCSTIAIQMELSQTCSDMLIEIYLMCLICVHGFILYFFYC